MSISDIYQVYMDCGHVTTDSRVEGNGGLFFALKGDQFDGNTFARQALEKGHAYAVIDDPAYMTEGDRRYILVDDTLKALMQLAHYHRRIINPKVIGITGTNGKTTTKELIATVLKKKYEVHATQGNYNNDIGVSLTLLGIKDYHDVAVIEMGASHPGDIKRLAEIAEPDYAIITNIGKAHLEGFGTYERIINTKGELYDYMRTKPNGLIIVSGDDQLLLGMAEGMKQIRYVINETKNAMVIGQKEKRAALLSLKWQHPYGDTHHLSTQLVGEYNIYNVLAAITTGLTLGVSPQDIDKAISEYKPNNNRSQLHQTKYNKIILDAYNANPTSMRIAIENFSEMDEFPKLAILGDMKELGGYSADEHQKIVNLLNELKIDSTWLVGEEFGKVDCKYKKFENIDSLINHVSEKRLMGYCILIKGSNSVRLTCLKDYL